MPRLINKKDVWAIAYGDFREFTVGRIKQDTLFLDLPSKHKLSNSYGIDRLVLESDKISYKYIQINIGHKSYVTSRKFWLHHGKNYKLNNGRDEVFLQITLFGAEKAIKFEEFLEVKPFLQMDIFDAMSHGQQAQYNLALQVEEEYNQTLEGKKIEL